LAASTQDTLYLLASNGKAAAFPIYQLPEGVVWEGVGTHYADLTPLTRRDAVVAAVALPPSVSDGYLSLVTSQGVVKRVALADLPGVSGEPFVVIGVDKEDALGWAAYTTGDDQLVLVTAGGKAIRFQEDEVRSMGLPAAGVMGIKLGGKDDRVVAFTVARPRSDLFVVASDGKAKRSPLTEYPTQGRYGQGVLTTRISASSAPMAGACVLKSSDAVVLVTERGAAKTLLAKNAPRKGRATVGESIIALRKQDTVVSAFVPCPRVSAE
jgi:DNA gyrase subunit A